MTLAETLKKQTGDTASDWLDQAKEAVKDLKVSDDVKARVIAAFLQAAAQDQHTMTIRTLAESGLLNKVGIS